MCIIFHCWHKIGTITQSVQNKHCKKEEAYTELYYICECCKCHKKKYTSQSEINAAAYAAEYG